jgi:hypothetical protein
MPPPTLNKPDLPAVTMRDALPVALTVMFGATVGIYFIATTGQAFFYQNFMPEIVMSACGRGFVFPLERPHELVDFLRSRLTTFDCRVLASVVHTHAAGIPARLHLYLAFATAMAWRWLGVSYANLWPVYAVLHGAYAAGCFVLFRLYVARWVALLAALGLAISPITVAMLYSLRDYSKAPFMIWSIALLLMAIRAGSAQRAIILSAIAGSILGFGTGFRSDVMIMLPIGAVVLAAGLRPPAQTWRTCLGAVAVFIAGTLIISAPVSKVESSGSGMLAMQGVTDPFVQFLGAGPAPYRLGWTYSDELSLSTTAADLRRTDPDWDAHEGKPLCGVTQSFTRSTRYFLGWAPLFAADFATHMIKSALSIAGFEMFISRREQGLDPAGWALRPVWYNSVLPQTMPAGIAAVLIVAGAAGVLSLLFGVFARNRREAACLALMIAYLLAYPATQFSIRHFFHLEFVSWLGVLALVNLPFVWQQIAHAKRPFAGIVVGIAAVLTATYGGLSLVQSHMLMRQISGLLALPRQAVAAEARSDETGQSVWKLPVPERYQALVSGRSDSLTSALPEQSIEWAVRAAADRLLITVGGSACAGGDLAIKFAYQKRADVFQPLDHTFVVTAPADGSQRSLLIAPAFYRPSQYLSAISVPADRKDCISGIDRLEGVNPLPVVFSAALVPDWWDHFLRQTLWK